MQLDPNEITRYIAAAYDLLDKHKSSLRQGLQAEALEAGLAFVQRIQPLRQPRMAPLLAQLGLQDALTTADLLQPRLASMAAGLQEFKQHRPPINPHSKGTGSTQSSTHAFAPDTSRPLPKGSTPTVPRTPDPTAAAIQATCSACGQRGILHTSGDAGALKSSSQGGGHGMQPCMSEAHLPVLMRCSACRLAQYCSHSCQKADWRGHRLTCKSTAAAAAYHAQHDAGTSHGQTQSGSTVGTELKEEKQGASSQASTQHEASKGPGASTRSQASATGHAATAAAAAAKVPVECDTKCDPSGIDHESGASSGTGAVADDREWVERMLGMLTGSSRGAAAAALDQRLRELQQL